MIFYPSITQNNGSEPFDLQVSRGQVLGHTPQFRFGFANSIGTTQQTITPAVAAGTQYAYLTAATTMKVSSSSASDTSAGTGARTLLLTGLNASYVVITETITLSGQTAVTTTNSFLRVLETKILTVGSGLAQAGTIYIGNGTVTSGVPATVYWRSEVDYNTAAFAGYTVPAGNTAFITSYTLTSQSTTANVNVSAALVVYEFGIGTPEIHM